MKEINLGKEMKALVDDADYDSVQRFGWHVVYNRGKYYAARKLNRRVYFMHCQIMGVIHGDKRNIDHIDGNGLNNQRSNLRFCTQQENTRNRRGKRGCSSRFKGVLLYRSNHWPPKGIKKWRAVIETGPSRKQISLGIFDREEEAARAYDAAAKKFFGEFARLNFPDKDSKLDAQAKQVSLCTR